MAEQNKVASSAVARLKAQADKVKSARNASQTQEAEIDIPLAKLRFDAKQVRQRYHTLDGRIMEKDQAYIEELARNIEKQGLIQPITVGELPDGTYVVRIGECRTRAHIFLGRETIRARVNNNLERRAARLIYQLSENLLRNDLDDWEVAAAVKELAAGNPEEGEPPMGHKEIAAVLGKSEGYLTRFVAFGDEELQKRWVESGIVDSAEKLYRLKLLPEHLKLDILRRVALDPTHSEHLAIPLKRSVIDDYSANSKLEKRRATTAPVTAPAAQGAKAAASTAPAAPASTNPAPSPAPKDEPPTAGADEPRPAPVEQPEPLAGGIQGNTEGYSLPPDVRAQLLVRAGAASEEAAPGTSSAGRSAVPPVGCKVPLSALERLLPQLRTKPDLLTSVRQVVCNIMLPADVAQQLVTVLTGVGADELELPMLLQKGLAELAE